MTLFFDASGNFHPFECDGPGRCIHHDRIVTCRGETVVHDPATCELFDPEYDYAPNTAWDERVGREARAAKRTGESA